MSQVTAIIVARMGSTRLPRKSMMPLMGKPMVERLIERVSRASAVDKIVLATTELPNDDPLARLAGDLDISCFRGASEDVLKRLYDTTLWSGGDPVLQILGDNPLLPSELIDDVVNFYMCNELDYAASATTEFPSLGVDIAKFPIGVRVEVISASAMEKCNYMAQDPESREHSLSWVYTHPEDFKVGYFPADGPWANVARPELTFAVNYKENMDLVVQLFDLCYSVNPNFPLSTVIEAIDAHPELKPLMGEPLQAIDV